MIREEEDDMTQEIKFLVATEVKVAMDLKIKKFISKIEGERPEIKDDYTQGVTDGLDWAVRILNGDKSAG